MNDTPPCSIVCCKGVLFVEGIYPVLFNNEKVGEVHLQKKGMYYYIFCKCRWHGKTPCVLLADCGDQPIKLGLLVPENDCHTLKTHVLCSKLPVGKVVFYITNYQMNGEITCVLKVDKSISCLEKLEYAYLLREGKTYSLGFKSNGH